MPTTKRATSQGSRIITLIAVPLLITSILVKAQTDDEWYNWFLALFAPPLYLIMRQNRINDQEKAQE